MAGYSLDGMGRRAPRITYGNEPEPDPAFDEKQAIFDARRSAVDSVFGDVGTQGADVGDEAGYTPPSPEIPSHLIPTPDWARVGFEKTAGSAVPRAGGQGAGMGFGLSRFLQTLNGNENIGSTDRYGSSPLFESVTNQVGEQVQPQADPVADLRETLAARRTGGVSPFRRRALDTLMA